MRASWSARPPSVHGGSRRASAGDCAYSWIEVTDGRAVARSAYDAPQIDGVVRIEQAGKLHAGDWADVSIVGADAYDLTGRLEPARAQDGRR